MKSILTYKKSQAWGIDLMIGVAIFLFGILTFYFYTINNPSEAKEKIDTFFYDGNLVSEMILSEGHPKDWQPENVIEIGILSGEKINQTKLERFYNLAETDYSKTKKLFNTRANYYVSFSDTITIGEEEVQGIGLPPENEQDLIKITRFTIYKEKPITMYVEIWE